MEPLNGPLDNPFDLLSSPNHFSSLDQYHITISARLWALQVMLYFLTETLTNEQKRSLITKAQHTLAIIDTPHPLPAGPSLKDHAIQQLNLFLKPLEQSLRNAG